MINTFYLYAAVAIMLIVIVTDLLKRKYNVDLNNFDYKEFSSWFKKSLKSGFKPMKETLPKPPANVQVINRSTGNNSLMMMSYGANKATVMATLRQITGLDYNQAKNIVNATPVVFMTNISDKEADLTKKALEFVGAKIEIK